jgi:hypothetical protein
MGYKPFLALLFLATATFFQLQPVNAGKSTGSNFPTARNEVITVPQDGNKTTVSPQSAKLSTRPELSLNGTWPVGGIVPANGRDTIKEKSYERTVEVPAGWSGKRIRLEFEKVNHSSTVFVNDKLVGNHTGGFIPFSYDISGLVQPGKSFRLRVNTKDGTMPPIKTEQGHYLWPDGGSFYSGIIDDVFLRAYGAVYIEDGFIQTSFRKGSLTVDYTLVNTDPVTRVVSLKGVVTEVNGTVVLEVPSQKVMIAAGTKKHITVTTNWKNPKYWTPDSPSLYYLCSQLVDGSTIVDEETHRFGFREIWIEGNQFILNGVRINVWGDNITTTSLGLRSNDCSPQEWPKTVDMLMHELNMRIIRFHRAPTPEYILDVADEKGLLIISESALFGSSARYLPEDGPVLVDNMVQHWIEPWIVANRNHPSIFMWSAMNEMRIYVPVITADQCLEVVNAISKFDPTRPVDCDGDGDVGAPVVNNHYPEGYETVDAVEKGNIYAWYDYSGFSDRPEKNKPSGFGEFLACPWVKAILPDVYWWHGTWIRGLRYLNFTDLRPFTQRWAWTQSTNPRARQNLANSYSPIALFDKDYDRLGIAPIMNEKYPELHSGDTVRHTLILFNDEFSGNEVDMKVALKSGTQVYTVVSKRITLQPGEHMEIPCIFTVPDIASGLLSLELSASKQGVGKFREDRFFRVTGKLKSAPEISLGTPQLCYPATCVETAVDFRPKSGGAPGQGVIRLTAHNTSATRTVSSPVSISLSPAVAAFKQPLFNLSIRPGETLTKDIDVELQPGKTMITALSESADINSSKIQIRVEGAITFLPDLTTPEQASAQLIKLPAITFTEKGESYGNARMALSGNYLAVFVHVDDPKMAQAAKPEDGSKVEVFGATPQRDNNTPGRVMLVPAVGDQPGYGMHFEKDAYVKTGSILMSTKAVEGGYDLTALIPLQLLTIDPKSESVLLELTAASSTPKGLKVLPYLFHSNNSMPGMSISYNSADYGLIRVVK